MSLMLKVDEVLMDMGEMGREREHSWLDTLTFLKLSVRLGSGPGLECLRL